LIDKQHSVSNGHGKPQTYVAMNRTPHPLGEGERGDGTGMASVRVIARGQYPRENDFIIGGGIFAMHVSRKVHALFSSEPP